MAVDNVMNLTNAKREDSGQYKIKAKNSEGKQALKFKIDVQYSPK